MKCNHILIPIVTLIIALASCARQTSPTGGPKDTIPPSLVESNPMKGKTNINPREITITFTENIQLNNPKEQILITPDIAKKYKIEAKNKTAVLKLDTTLLDNTTYLINFREAIQDLTEKNPAVNLKIAFSTGQYIDSIALEGKTKDLLKNSDYKDATVALYASDTFNIFKQKPTYITKSDKYGNYKFEYLKNGKYYIYAFDDKNKNLTVDSKTESFAFKAQPLTLDTNQKQVVLELVRLDSRPLKLTSARPYNTYSLINFSKGLKDYRLTTDNQDSVVSMTGETSATIQVFNTFTDMDSVKMRVTAIDSINQKSDTTLYVKFLKRQSTPEKFTVTLSQPKLIKTKALLQATGTFTKPIAILNYDSIYIQKDSVTRIPIPPQDISINPRNKTLSITSLFTKAIFPPDQDAPTKPKSTNKMQMKLKLGKAAFISIENDSSAASEQNLSPLTEEDLGLIKIQIQTKEPSFITELLTKDFKVVQTSRNKPQVTFQDVQPGDYLLRITIDKDNDGKWSPGNFLSRQEPENFVFYQNDKKQTTITLKANWELGPLLIKF